VALSAGLPRPPQSQPLVHFKTIGVDVFRVNLESVRIVGDLGDDQGLFTGVAICQAQALMDDADVQCARGELKQCWQWRADGEIGGCLHCLQKVGLTVKGVLARMRPITGQICIRRPAASATSNTSGFNRTYIASIKVTTRATWGVPSTYSDDACRQKPASRLSRWPARSALYRRRHRRHYPCCCRRRPRDRENTCNIY
jgi:hypothetical protein